MTRDTVITFCVLMFLFSIMVLSARTEQRVSVVTCTIQEETATANGRAEVSYYECLATNGAIVPAVTFVVFRNAPGELWLRELAGRTVDVRLEVVR